MTETLRERLAAVLGPGNDDAAAYAQADAVLDVISVWSCHIVDPEQMRLHQFVGVFADEEDAWAAAEKFSAHILHIEEFKLT